MEASNKFNWPLSAGQTALTAALAFVLAAFIWADQAGLAPYWLIGGAALSVFALVRGSIYVVEHFIHRIRSQTIDSYDQLLADLPVPAIFFRTVHYPDGRRKVEYISPRDHLLVGLSRQQMINHPDALAHAIHPEDLPSYLRKFTHSIENLEPFDWDGRMIVNGEERWHHVQAYPKRRWDGGVTWTGIRRDVTYRKHTSDALLQVNLDLERRITARTAALAAANEELERLSALKDDFIANITHELHTPIAGIKVTLKVAELDPGNMPNYLGRIEREIERLNRIIDDLLLLSRMAQGQARLIAEAVELNPIIDSFLQDRLPLLIQKQLCLRFDPAPNLPRVNADPGLLEIAFSTVMTNACNYTPTGGQIVAETRTEFDEQGRLGVLITISDSGPGITPEDIPHIFERFYRGQAAVQKHVSGTGLGLAIAKEIVEAHGGHISVKSPGRFDPGTCFCIWLPALDQRSRDAGPPGLNLMN